jgi:hypothetical protein
MPKLNRRPRSHLVPVRQLLLRQPPLRQLPLGKPVVRPKSSRWGGHKQLILAA